MCEVRAILDKGVQTVRIDIAGYQNQIQTVAILNRNEDSSSVTETWSKLTGWPVVRYTEETETIKVLKKVQHVQNERAETCSDNSAD